ncbi:hypothetical protein RI129_003167 [Pyrocoelia pectoralis]|uniref:Regulatory protein zeste n=1 Tax=Pyrocoelia pectoralis TaxID=417401 RepID=A0AAN7ZIF7_9COLE
MCNENEAKGRGRGANFSATEKQFVLSLVYKFKKVIENKKTDAVTNEEKQQAWLQITKEFNSSCPDGRRRDIQALKKFYANRKKEIKKIVAEETKERYLTGGGTPKIVTCDDKELVLSLMSDKTVYGLEGMHDSDSIGIVQENCDEDAEVVIEDEEVEPPTKRLKECAPVADWSKVKPTMLTTPTNSALRKANGSFDGSRRRPATIVRALSSSVIAEKYELLVDKRLTIADMEIKKLAQELKWQNEKQNLEREAMMLNIEIKKATLKLK